MAFIYAKRNAYTIKMEDDKTLAEESEKNNNFEMLTSKNRNRNRNVYLEKPMNEWR